MKNFILEVKLSVPNNWVVEERFDAIEWQHEMRKAIEEEMVRTVPTDHLDEIKISVRRVMPRKKSQFKIKKTKLYTFDQLSKTAKEKAIYNEGFCNVNDEWWESIYSDAKAIGLKLQGFDLDHGAQGQFIHGAIETADKIIQEHGKDCETHKDALKFLAERDALVKKYSSEDDRERVAYEHEYEFDNDCDELEKDFLKTLLEDYRIILRNEHDYLTSEAVIIETIKANNWTFTREGKLQN